jgi:hypothetical protein
MTEFIFIKNIQSTDLDLFFGPIDNEVDKIIPIADNEIMANLLSKADVFPSVSQARKNGWDKPIPFGFTDFRTGKKKIRISILNIDNIKNL